MSLHLLCPSIPPAVALSVHATRPEACVFMKQMDERPDRKDLRIILTIEEIPHDSALRDSPFEVDAVLQGHEHQEKTG